MRTPKLYRVYVRCSCNVCIILNYIFFSTPLWRRNLPCNSLKTCSPDIVFNNARVPQLYDATSPILSVVSILIAVTVVGRVIKAPFAYSYIKLQLHTASAPLQGIRGLKCRPILHNCFLLKHHSVAHCASSRRQTSSRHIPRLPNDFIKVNNKLRAGGAR